MIKVKEKYNATWKIVMKYLRLQFKIKAADLIYREISCWHILMKRCVRGETFSKELAKNFWKLPLLYVGLALHTLQIIHSSSFPILTTEVSSTMYDVLEYSKDSRARGARIEVLESKLVPGFFRQCRAREIIRSSRGNTCLEMCTTRIQSQPLLDCALGLLLHVTRNACANCRRTEERGGMYPSIRRHGYFY